MIVPLTVRNAFLLVILESFINISISYLYKRKKEYKMYVFSVD